MIRQGVENGTIAGKYGGTSNANPDRVRAIRDITLSSPNRNVITVSAPGYGDKKDPFQNFRVTEALKMGKFDLVFTRFDQMALDLFGHDERYARIHSKIEQTRRRAAAEGISPYSESRGEDIQGRIVAELIGAKYLDPQKYVLLNSDGSIHPETYNRIRSVVRHGKRYVMGGYFGANIDTGEVQLLPPGGTDITGAILAKAVEASVYENFTDVKGVLAADPRLFPKKQRDKIKGVSQITFDEMGELSYRGAGILQVDAVGPAREAGIPINVRSSFHPDHPGTMVVESRIAEDEGVIGIASKKGFVSIRVTQAGMNKRKGIMARLGEVFEENGVSLEQGPGGNDYMSVIFHENQLRNGTGQQVMRDIRAQIQDSSLAVVDRRGLVSIVGKNLQDEMTATSINADVFVALRDARIGHGAHIQAERPISSVISVRNDDTQRAVRVLYDALIKKS